MSIAPDERRIGPVLMVLCVLLYVPFAGTYGLWDPWETHYGEVARQMAARHDYVSLWYPCSPLEGRWFWSKPVLSFWLMAPCLRLFGLQGEAARAGELVDSWRAEWACRMPSMVLGLVGVWAVYTLVRRLASARAAAMAGLVLATSPSWFLVSRQAMTDMPFVVPMTIALVLAGLAILSPDEDLLPRRRLGRLSWPHAGAFYGLLAIVALAGIPQLVVIASQLRGRILVGGLRLSVPGVVVMLPYVIGLVLGIVLSARVQRRRALYLLQAYVWCAVATLAKGPAGLALPALILVAHLLCARRGKEILLGLELPRGLLLFVVIAFPWYHAMLVRHGWSFWRELIGDNYVHRALGRHGDRGTFEYYLQWIAYGTFPWSGLLVVAALRAFRARDDRAMLVRYALAWLLIDLVVFTSVRTKFHHYLLPTLPALAILGGLFLDELIERGRAQWAALLVVALPVTALCGLDLAALPARILWLFNYDYVNMPGLGRPWPSRSLYGDRYEYGVAIAILASLAFVAYLALLACRRVRTVTAPDLRVLALWAGLVLAIGILVGPSTDGAASEVEPLRWLLPVVLVAPVLVWLARAIGLPLAMAPLLAVAVAWGGFVADKLLVELSPHWSQKHVIASYYARRAGPEEPLLVWELFWRGENFYTANEIYASPVEDERTVFLGHDTKERLGRYLAGHGRRRVFFLVERAKLALLRAALPPELKDGLTLIDESNNKLVLAVVKS